MLQFRVRPAPLSLAAALCAISLGHAPVVARDAPLTEEAAIERAFSREGLAARDTAQRAAADAEIGLIGPLDNPTVEVSRESAGGESEWQIGVVQPIDLNGRRGRLRAAARAEAEAVDADIARRRQVLAAGVRKAFVACAATRAEHDVRARHAKDLSEAERVSTARAQAGDTAVYDVRRVRVEQRAAEAELAQARGAVAGECGLLGALTGFPTPTVELASITAVESGVGNATSSRADLLASERRLVAATQRVGAARASRLPQIAVGAGIKRVDDGTGTAYGPVVSLGVTLPVWTGGGAFVRREQALRSAQEAELSIARRTIEAEQATAAARASAAREAAVTAARARDDAGRLGAIAETAYQAGEIGVVELLDAYEAARDADLSVIAFAQAAAEAVVEYDLATGRTY